MQDLNGLKPERLDAVEDPLAGPEQDRGDVERELVDDPGDEVPIPGQDFGFRRLIRAQAEGDFRSLQERGRKIVRVRLENV